MFLNFDNLYFCDQTGKNLQAAYISILKTKTRKHNFSESVLCHCEMFYLTTVGLDIGVCIVHVVIFIKKYLTDPV